MGESAVVLAVPEAQGLVGAWRDHGDPEAARGLPAHVTLLRPFLPSEHIDVGVIAELEWFFAGVDGFALSFTDLHREQDVLGLAPDDVGPLNGLARALALRWPECREALVRQHPRVTVVRGGDPAVRETAESGVQAALPVTSVAAEAELWVCDDEGTWTRCARLPLAPPEED